MITYYEIDGMILNELELEEMAKINNVYLAEIKYMIETKRLSDWVKEHDIKMPKRINQEYKIEPEDQLEMEL
jgi:hypothetical protein